MNVEEPVTPRATTNGSVVDPFKVAVLDPGARFVYYYAHLDAYHPGLAEGQTVRAGDPLGASTELRAALDAGLEVIVCVGETEAERDSGNAEAVVAGQLDASMPQGEGLVPRLTVAYEPVWAIGTGRVAAPADVAAMHAVLRARLLSLYGEEGANVRILYGGSVNAGNAAELLSTAEVGGALVGGASLTAESFLAIVAAAGPAAD